MRRWLIFLLLFCGCASPQYYVRPGTVVALQFVQDDAAVKMMAERLNLQYSRQFLCIKALYWAGGHLVIVSSASVNPQILAHEILRVAGRNDLADEENRNHRNW